MLQLLDDRDLCGPHCKSTGLISLFGTMVGAAMNYSPVKLPHNPPCTNWLVLCSIIEQKPLLPIDAVSLVAQH
jgi:hypothetical protein